MDSTNSGFQAGVVLGDDGLPTTSCGTCGGGSFWALPDLPPEFGAWRCDRCEPRPAELLAHSCGVPIRQPPAAFTAPWTCPALADLPLLGRATPPGSPTGSATGLTLPDLDDGIGWCARATAACQRGGLEARGDVARQWALAAGGRVLIENGRRVLAVPLQRATACAIDMERIAADAGMAMRFDNHTGERAR